MKKIELVVPAGGYEQMKTAVLAGADSIYAGFEKYSARAYADNFNLKNLKKASEYCHSNNVKFYVAINTIIKENELYELIDLVSDIVKKIKIDAFIVQDFALLKILKDLDSAIPVHASTQMNIHNSPSASFLKKYDIKRIIPSRELTLDEIIRLVKSNIIDIEIFCHGSQCYSYSGQCYFSSSVGRRSGNRGTCPQPCRMKYILNNKENGKNLNKEEYFLSKCDLSLIDKLPDIIKAGVKAVKIEGRMKTPEYVAIVTSIYRKYIDIFYKNMDYAVDIKDMQKLKQVFSRKFNSGYFFKKFPEEIISFKKSGSIGNLFGRISGIEIKKEKKIMSIESGLDLNKEDILEIWTKKGNVRVKIKNFIKENKKNKNIKKSKFKIETDKKIFFAIGDRVFKYFDKSIDEEVKGILKRKNKPENKLIIDENEIKKYNFSIEEKRIRNLKNNIIYSEIGKKRGVYKSVSSYKMKNSISLISSEINDFSNLLNRNNAFKNEITNNSGIKINFIYDIFSTDKNNFAEKRERFTNDLLDISRSNSNDNIVFYFLTPSIIHDDDLDYALNLMDYLIQSGFYNFYVSNYAFLEYLNNYKKEGKSFNIILAHNFNIANSFNLDELLKKIDKNLLLKEIIFSPEISINEANNVIIDFYEKIIDKKSSNATLPVMSFYSYGFFPIMEARVKYDFLNNPGKNVFLKDEKNFSFMLKNNFSGNTVVFNSKKHNLISEIGILMQGLIGGFLIDARTLKRDESIFAINSFYEAVKINRGFITDYFDRKKIIKAEKETEELVHNLLKSQYFKDFTKGHTVKEII
ncbi:MAG: U32 family peptidase [Actinomycetota bacterium]|nr:U32 family peptidase [Actinomycetota bacterium]